MNRNAIRILEDRLPGFVRDPPGNADGRKVPDTAEQAVPVCEHPFCPVEQERIDRSAGRAVAARFLPLETIGAGVVATSSGVEPAVVLGRHYGDMLSSCILQYHRQTDVATVKIVQVDNIRLVAIVMAQEQPGGDLRKIPLLAADTGQ